MTRLHATRRLTAASISLLLLAPLGAVALTSQADARGMSSATAASAQADPAASASGFLYFKFPLGTPVCSGVGLNVSTDPSFSRDDCGFANFTLSGTATTVQAKLFADGASTPFATLDAVEDSQTPGDYQVDLAPDASWPVGKARLQILADGVPAGESTFNHNLLQAQFDDTAAFAPGVDIPVSGTVVDLDNDGPTDTSNTGVPATFTLKVTKPDGTVIGTPQEVTAGSDGTFAATVPGSSTTGISAGPDQNFRTEIGLRAVDAAYVDPGTPPLDPGTGAWAALDAGSGSATIVSEPTALVIQNSFVSSVGWVKPGDTYPSRLIVKNGVAQGFDNVTVTVPAPVGATFTQARPGGSGTATITNGTVTWNIGHIDATNANGPTVATLILESQANTLAQDPELVWKDLSSTATLSVAGVQGGTATSHGPRVIPQSETYDTARYGDRPFPVVPVDYLDRKHQASNSGHELAEKLNSPSVPGSTFNLYQEMSLGQLYPNGTVPSSDIATADFPAGKDFGFTQLAPAGTCHGATTPAATQGSALYPERIKDGFYQLPGDTDYYGDDKFGSAVVGSVAGVGTLQDIDSACGPTGKLVFDAAAIADPEIDYSDYDTDKDGVVDFFMVVFAGCGGNGSSQLSVAGCAYPDAPYDNVWPHSSSLESYYTDPETGLAGFTTDDQLKDLEGRPLYYTDVSRSTMTLTVTDFKVFVRVGPYNVNPETAIDKASVISHEYGHSLGLPDFYSTGSRETYGDWNLLATDKSQNMDVFSRQELGWVVPEVLKAGDTQVTGWTDSKQDTNTVTWQRKDGTPYTLSGPGVHNSLAYVAKLPGRRLIDPAKFDTGDKASATHAWWSGSGNDFGCAPQGGHNLDVVIPGLKDLPSGSTVKVDFKSLFDIEWDFDYGFVMTSTNGGESYTSHPSLNNLTTTTNPNQSACQTTYGNGITGSSGSFAAGSDATDRLLGTYPDSVFLADSYDISDLAGTDNGVLRFSYATDPGLARPGWFIDDLLVTATTPSGDTVLLDSDLETDGGPNDARIYNGGCKNDLTVAKTCTKGWNYINASSEAPSDHAYYLEMRDRSGFDFDSHGQNDRDPIGWAPGLSLVYTDEAHGYGNFGTDNPPAQSPLDSAPEPGSDTPNLNDAAFTAAASKSGFSDSGEGHTDNYTNPAETSTDPNNPTVVNPWRFQYGCLTFDVLRMVGEDVGPSQSDGNLTGDVSFNLASGCGTFGYGYVDVTTPPPVNTNPVANATASPQQATTGQDITLDARNSTDAETPSANLDYSWDFGNGGSTKDSAGSVAHATYDTAGTYTATVTVTDGAGATDTDAVQVVVSAPTNTKPVARAKASDNRVLVREPIVFDGAGSTDAETPSNLTYSWNYGNGGSAKDAAGRKVTKKFTQADVYTVTLTVTDPKGAKDTASVTVRVGRKVSCASPAVGRTGSWRESRSAKASGGRYCDNLGRRSGKDKLTMSFTGGQVALKYAKARRGGPAKVVIDGTQVGVVRFRGTSKAPRFGYSHSFGGLGAGEHTLKLVMVKGAGYVDDFMIWGDLR